MSNLINFGILPLVFVNTQEYDSIDQGDQMEIDMETVREQERAIVRNTTKNISIPVSNSLTAEEIEIIKQGGHLNWMKERSRAR